MRHLRFLLVFASMSVFGETFFNYGQPTSTNATYPISLSRYFKGSLMTWMTNVSQLTNTIASQGLPVARREAGMLSAINGVYYQLGSDLTTWTVLSITASPSLSVLTTNQLRSLVATNLPNNALIYMGGYYQNGDGGGGPLYVDTSDTTTPDDGGSTFVVAGIRVKAIFPDNKIPLTRFGALGDNNFDSTVAITNAIWFAGGREIVVPFGKYKITDTIRLVSSAAQTFRTSTSGHNLIGQSTSVALSSLTTNSQDSAFIQWTDNIPIIEIEGVHGRITDMAFLYHNVQDRTNTSAKAIAASGSLIAYWDIRNIAIDKCNTVLHCPVSTFWVNNHVENVHVNRFSQYGLLLEGGGTQSLWDNIYLRANPDIPTQTGTGASNVSTNVTVTGLTSPFTDQLFVGQLITVTGASPSEFNGFFSLRGKTATTISYTLASAPSGSISGTPTVDAIAKDTVNGIGVYTNPDHQSVWNVLNVEWMGGLSAVWFKGKTVVNGLHVEGFQARAGAGNIIQVDQPTILTGVELINCVLATNSTWSAFYQNGAHLLQINGLQVRDNYLNPGAFLYAALGPNDTAQIRLDGPKYNSSFRWDRTGDFSSWGQMEQAYGTQKEFFSAGAFQFGNTIETIVNQSGAAGFAQTRYSLIGTNYGGGAKFWDLKSLNGTNRYAHSILGNITIIPTQSTFFDYGGATNASRVRIGGGDTTTDRILDFNAQTFQSGLSSDTNATHTSYAFQPFGGNATFFQGPDTTNAHLVTFNSGNPEAGATVTFGGTNGGVIFPFMTSAQIDAIVTPVNGVMTFNTEFQNVDIFRNGSWGALNGIQNVASQSTNNFVVGGRNTSVLVAGSGVRTNVLPAASLFVGKIVTIKDGAGNSTDGTIWITSNGGSIDGFAYDSITSNYGSKTYFSDGSNWYSSGEKRIQNIFGAASGLEYSLRVTPVVAQSATAGFSALYIDPVFQSEGSGLKYVIDAKYGGNGLTNVFNVTSTGVATVTGGGAAVPFLVWARTGIGSYGFSTSSGFTSIKNAGTGDVLLSVSQLASTRHRISYGTPGTDPSDWAGSGTPEGTITDVVGSTYRRTDGGAGTSFYVKESGSGNTGWTAK